MSGEFGILDIDLEGTPEMATLPDGTVAGIRIIGAELRPRKDNVGQFMLLRYDTPDHVNVFDFTSTIMLPREGDDERQVLRAKNRVIDFFKAFGVKHSGSLSMESLVGLEGRAILSETEREGFGLQNGIRRFLEKR